METPAHLCEGGRTEEMKGGRWRPEWEVSVDGEIRVILFGLPSITLSY